VTFETLRKARDAEPFVPFSVSLADGRRFLVPEPGYLFVPPVAARIFLVYEAPNEYSSVDLLLVTSLDFHPAKMQRRRRGSNGNGRKAE